jgi:tRNA-specific 2-thiouridylase
MNNSINEGKKKVLAAMSGGVDSSAAALLLKEAGYNVTGITMCLGIREDGDRTRCCGLDAIDDARRVCDELQIPHFVFDYAGEMEERVIGKFIAEYLRGRTPNPCIDCNRYLKFGTLLNKARGMGFDYLATGHYARIAKHGDDWHLLRPKDRIKDQTYFLYPIAAADLSSVLFPLGELNKEEVRALTKKAGLHVAHKAESQDICFVTQGSYGQFFQERNVPSATGDIVDKTGRVLGKHKGIFYYTIGQRGGLGISAKTPLYVIEINVAENRIVVGEKKDLYSAGLVAGDINLFTADFPSEVEAKIRYRKKPARCKVFQEDDKLRIIFQEPQESITPGQAVVLYAGDRVLGGGTIEEVITAIYTY